MVPWHCHHHDDFQEVRRFSMMETPSEVKTSYILYDIQQKLGIHVIFSQDHNIKNHIRNNNQKSRWSTCQVKTKKVQCRIILFEEPKVTSQNTLKWLVLWLVFSSVCCRSLNNSQFKIIINSKFSATKLKKNLIELGCQKTEKNWGCQESVQNKVKP